jgi:hypothetical protein
LEEILKTICMLLLVLLLLFSVSAAQNAPARTDVYHVHFAAAAPGKAVQLADSFKTPLPNAPMPGHTLVLRHNYGDAWDYVVIQHMGTKATVEATPSAIPSSVRDLYAWHNDTFVNGPSWADFTRAMGIGEQTSKTSGSEYVVSVYRAVPGHRDQLEKMLSGSAQSGAVGNVLMQHLEGGPWNYLSIVRFNSWHDLATSETNDAAQMSKNQGPWFDMRDHAIFHNDTLADRIVP